MNLKQELETLKPDLQEGKQKIESANKQIVVLQKECSCLTEERDQVRKSLISLKQEHERLSRLARTSSSVAKRTTDAKQDE